MQRFGCVGGGLEILDDNADRLIDAVC